jgi:NADH-quinone oxidoreductase subunit N
MKPIATPFDTAQLLWHAPLLVVVGGALLMLLLEAFARGSSRRWLMHLSAFAFALAGLVSVVVFIKIGAQPRTLFGGMLAADRFALFFCILFSAAGCLVSLLSGAYLEQHGSSFGEYYSLLLLGVSGMMILALAGDLVTIFLGIETMSLAAYVLTAGTRRSKRSQEAGMKYFITGAFASGFLLYGIALIYGATGNTNLEAIRASGATGTPIFIVGELLLIVAFGFKVAAVPFHMWAPDAYEGAPTPITAFMAAGIKAAAFSGLFRLFLTAFGGDVLPFGPFGWATILGILAAATMTLGNIAALKQESVKRLLAYSSISHAGYLLIGVVAAGVTQDPALSDVVAV